MTQDQTNSRTVWRAQVSEHNGYPAETYYFWDERDALDTVRTTWSGAKDKITTDREGSRTIVRSNDPLKQVLVCIEPITLGSLVCDKPSHF
jgi:hypothetical protein